MHTHSEQPRMRRADDHLAAVDARGSRHVFASVQRQTHARHAARRRERITDGVPERELAVRRAQQEGRLGARIQGARKEKTVRRPIRRGHRERVARRTRTRSEPHEAPLSCGAVRILGIAVHATRARRRVHIRLQCLDDGRREGRHMLPHLEERVVQQHDGLARSSIGMHGRGHGARIAVRRRTCRRHGRKTTGPRGCQADRGPSSPPCVVRRCRRRVLTCWPRTGA